MPKYSASRDRSGLCWNVAVIDNRTLGQQVNYFGQHVVADLVGDISAGSSKVDGSLLRVSKRVSSRPAHPYFFR